MPGVPPLSPSFRFVCVPTALVGAPGSWAREMLRDGEIALLPTDGGLAAIDEVAHDLGLVSVGVIRGEADGERQQRTVIEYAQALPLIWVGESFDESTTQWAQDRGPMTLLVQAGGRLSPAPPRRPAGFPETPGPRGALLFPSVRGPGGAGTPPLLLFGPAGAGEPAAVSVAAARPARTAAPDPRPGRRSRGR